MLRRNLRLASCASLGTLFVCACATSPMHHDLRLGLEPNPTPQETGEAEQAPKDAGTKTGKPASDDEQEKKKREQELEKMFDIGDPTLRNKVLERFYKDDIEKIRKQRIDRSQHFQLTAGTVMLNPYQLVDLDAADPTSGFVVDTGEGTDTHGYIEATFQYRTAWLSKSEIESLAKAATSSEKPGFLIPDDYEAKLGFVLDTEDLSGSAAPGSGDAYLDMMFGWNLFDPGSSETRHRHTMNVEALLGLTTDIGAQDIHDYQGIGLTSVWSIDRESARPIQVLLGAFFSRFESPEFLGNQIVEEKGFPEFDDETGIIWRSDMHVPLGDAGYLSLSGRFHSGVSDLNPWTISLGYTLPLAALFDGIAGD